MLVSIIIPVYNVELYIKNSLLSALNQSFTSIEYIIVDDCGTDKSMDIVQYMIKEHPRGKDVHIYKHEKNRGLSVARNTGIKNATGEYIFFMDSDDEITEDCIELQYHKMIEENPDFVVSNMKIIGTIWSLGVTRKIKFLNKINNDILRAYFRIKWSNSSCNKLYKKRLITDNDFEFVEGLICEDQLWNYKIALKAQKISVVQKETYLYKKRDNSITSTGISRIKIESQLYILNCIKSDWNAGIIPHELKDDLFYYLTYKRFSLAYPLLRYSGSYQEKREYYHKINSPEYLRYSNKNIQAYILRLPFVLFYILKLPYFAYRLLKYFIIQLIKIKSRFLTN
jgi:glycosyltransferase involved in cell wall biosynthesis